MLPAGLCEIVHADDISARQADESAHETVRRTLLDTTSSSVVPVGLHLLLPRHHWLCQPCL